MSYECLYFPLKQEKGPDLSVVTATAGDVDEGKIFVNSSGQEVEGTSTYKADYTALNTLVGQTTATAEDVAQGKVFVNASGVQTTGTASGGIDENFIKLIERTNNAVITIPNGVTKIGNRMAANYGTLVGDTAALKGVILPDTIQSIEKNAFYACNLLELSELPSNLKIIGDQAFHSCFSITTLTFKGTATSISSNAFQGCSNLTTINVPWSSGAVAGAPWGATNATIVYDYVPTP